MEERPAGMGLASWRNDNVVGEGIDPKHWQCKGPEMHRFHSERDPAVCPECGEDVGLAPRSAKPKATGR